MGDDSALAVVDHAEPSVEATTVTVPAGYDGFGVKKRVNNFFIETHDTRYSVDSWFDVQGRALSSLAFTRWCQEGDAALARVVKDESA